MTSLANKYKSLLKMLHARPLACGFAVGFALCLFLIGRLVFSGFSVLDDHAVIGWFGEDAWSRIASTELAHYGDSARFRPVMYVILICESLVFGANPLPYHVMQILLFGIFLSALAWASFRSVGILAGLLILLLTVNGHYWGNIWGTSLFAAEQTASFGLGLVVFGYGLFCSWFISAQHGKLDRALLLASAGTLVCVGSKENFLPLIPLNMAFIAIAWRQRAVATSTLAASVCLVAAQFAICYGILLPNLKQLSDSNPGTGLSARIAAIFHTKRFALRAYLSLAGGITAGVRAVTGNLSRPARRTRELFVMSGLLIWCGVYICWEQFFYNGLLPTGYRYDFPSLLIDPILAGAAFYALMRMHDRFGWMRAQFSVLALQVFFVQACLILMIWPAAQLSLNRSLLFPARSAVRTSGEHSIAMIHDLDRTRLVVAQHPEWPIIIRATDPENYEAVLTFPIWLKYFRISNPVSIEVNIPPAEIHSPTEQGMVEGMRDRSAAGVPGQYVARDAAILNAQTLGHCYITEFQVSDTRCTHLPYHAGAYYPVEE